MSSSKIICSSCGAAVESDLAICPHCERHLARGDSEARPLLAEIHRRSADTTPNLAATSPLPYLSPDDDPRRFPLLTRGRLTILTAAVFLLALTLAVGYLLWRQQRRDSQVAVVQPPPGAEASPVPSATANASPTSTPQDDAAVLNAVRAAVTNYNPTGFSNYLLEIKDGIVTVGGSAETQPEKDGVENVIRAVTGVRAIVNNLIVRLTPVMMPSRLSEAEAKRLEEALRKGQDADRKAKTDEDARRQQLDAQRELDRPRREAAAARVREEEDRARREAEEKLEREAADYERRLEDQRRLEAERRARAEQARLEASVLRSGTIAWTGIVDGVAEIIISGASASVRNVSGEPAREVKSSFSAQVPRAPVSVKLLASTGRGQIAISQEPTAANGYATIVRVDDGGKGGSQRYEFTLRWSVR